MVGGMVGGRRSAVLEVSQVLQVGITGDKMSGKCCDTVVPIPKLPNQPLGPIPLIIFGPTFRPVSCIDNSIPKSKWR